MAGRASFRIPTMNAPVSAQVRTPLRPPALAGVTSRGLPSFLSRMLASCVVASTVVMGAMVAPAAHGIEMFTYFGDGSRIGLPSLEVPIEAYPGIPLRSDRIRARRRAMQMGPGSAVRLGPPGVPTKPGGIIIRAMPQQPPAVP